MSLNIPSTLPGELAKYKKTNPFVTLRFPVIVDSIGSTAVTKEGTSFMKGDTLLMINNQSVQYRYEFEEIKKKLATWLLYIINLTLFLLPSLQIMIRHKMGGLIVSTMLITLCITLSLSAIAFAKPELINTTQWKPYLFVALVILLLGYLVPIFSCLAGVCNNAFLNSWGYYIAILAVIIFSFVLLYHTKEVIQNAEKFTFCSWKRSLPS